MLGRCSVDLGGWCCVVDFGDFLGFDLAGCVRVGAVWPVRFGFWVVDLGGVWVLLGC